MCEQPRHQRALGQFAVHEQRQRACRVAQVALESIAFRFVRADDYPGRRQNGWHQHGKNQQQQT
jgi:hypothetical protein